MISIGGLFLLDDPLFRSMAIGTISVVLVAVVGSLTFLPATFAILGDGVNRLRIPSSGRDREEGSGLWAILVRAVMRVPVLAAGVSAAFLLLLASPVLRLHMGQADFTSFPDTLDGVQAVNLLNEKWPSGGTLELDVVVTEGRRPGDAGGDRRPVGGGPGDRRSERAGGKVHVLGRNRRPLTYVMNGGGNDLRNQEIVREIRSDVVPAALASAPDARVYVSGEAAYTLDIVTFYSNGMPQVMAFVLAFSFILLLVAFRSVVIPIKAILLNLLRPARPTACWCGSSRTATARTCSASSPVPSRRSCPSSSSRSCSGFRWTTTSSS